MRRTFGYLAALAIAAGPAAAQPLGMVCQTPYGWCGMPGPAPVGSQCYCATPQGPIYGVVR
jgi:hypothetical protein